MPKAKFRLTKAHYFSDKPKEKGQRGELKVWPKGTVLDLTEKQQKALVGKIVPVDTVPAQPAPAQPPQNPPQQPNPPQNPPQGGGQGGGGGGGGN